GPFYFLPGQAPQPQDAGVSKLLDAARLAYQNGSFEEAAANFERALKIDPENPLTYNALGSARFRMRQWSLAVAQFSRAIELKPDYAAAFFNRGVAYFNTP